jgi:hypothetical protein
MSSGSEVAAELLKSSFEFLDSVLQVLDFLFHAVSPQLFGLELDDGDSFRRDHRLTGRCAAKEVGIGFHASAGTGRVALDEGSVWILDEPLDGFLDRLDAGKFVHSLAALFDFPCGLGAA